MDKVCYGSGLIQGNGVAEVPAMHGGRVGRRLIAAGAEPGQALLKGNPLGDREMDWIQLRMSIDPAVVPDVRPGKGAKVGGKGKYLFFSFCRSWNRVGFFL